jgi:hypothetical protein
VLLLEATYQLKPYALQRATTPGQEEERITFTGHKQQRKAMPRFALGRSSFLTIISSA